MNVRAHNESPVNTGGKIHSTNIYKVEMRHAPNIHKVEKTERFAVKVKHGFTYKPR